MRENHVALELFGAAELASAEALRSQKFDVTV